MEISAKIIKSKIFEIRGHKVMLDVDLAEMYEVDTKVFNQFVKKTYNDFHLTLCLPLLRKSFRL